MGLTDKVVAGLTALTVSCTASIEQQPKDSSYISYGFGNGDSVSVNKEVINHLAYTYDSLQRELPLCLIGEKQDRNYLIRNLEFPFFSSSEENSSRFNSDICHQKDYNRGEYLGMVHNHISGNCQPSVVDYQRFTKDSLAELEMVVCEANKEQNRAKFTIERKSKN